MAEMNTHKLGSLFVSVHPFLVSVTFIYPSLLEINFYQNFSSSFSCLLGIEVQKLNIKKITMLLLLKLLDSSVQSH